MLFYSLKSSSAEQPKASAIFLRVFAEGLLSPLSYRAIVSLWTPTIPAKSARENRFFSRYFLITSISFTPPFSKYCRTVLLYTAKWSCQGVIQLVLKDKKRPSLQWFTHTHSNDGLFFISRNNIPLIYDISCH